MRFSIGDAVVDIIVDDDDLRLPLSQFLPGFDQAVIKAQRGMLELRLGWRQRRRQLAEHLRVGMQGVAGGAPRLVWQGRPR